MSKSIFEPVTLAWGKDTYEIPAELVMGLIERIEDHVTFGDLADNKVKFGKIAAAYGTALRYAGCRVTNEEVYRSILDGASFEQVTSAINGLMMIMVPPGRIQKKTKDGPETETSQPESQP